jgi:hypothetical protein
LKVVHGIIFKIDKTFPDTAAGTFPVMLPSPGANASSSADVDNGNVETNDCGLACQAKKEIEARNRFRNRVTR